MSLVVARRERRATLMETETREILAEYGVPLVAGRLCRSLDDVTAALADFTGPVALKAVSPAVSHKTEAGGVALDVSGPEAAKAAFEQVLQSAATYAVAHGFAPDIRGVLVAPMLPKPVAEIIVGVRQDPQFGPMLTVGAGGVHVEIHKDTALRGLPIGRPEALEMLQELRTARLLRGYRGRPAANVEALADVMLCIAACALDHSEIEEIEANPIFAYPDRAIVVDARAFVKGPS